MPRQLKALNIPELAAHLWGYFGQLHRERPNNGFSVGRLTSSIIKDWCQVYQVDLELWEIKALKRMDEAWIKLQEEKRKND